MVEKSQEYKRADPYEIANSIIFLNLDQLGEKYFWIGRVYASIPLPDKWEKIVSQDSIYYNYLDLQGI